MRAFLIACVTIIAVALGAAARPAEIEPRLGAGASGSPPSTAASRPASSEPGALTRVVRPSGTASGAPYSFWFIAAYLLCGLGGQGLHTLLSRGSLVPCVGASGAISGVAGMYFLLYPRSPFDLILYFGWWIRKSFRATTRGAIGTWIGEQFLLGLIFKAVGGSGGGIAFWAHVGGFVSGLFCAALILPRATAEEREMILRPKPLSQEEKDEIFADRAEKPSGLTTLKLSD